jgi:hypothetical protein
VFLQGACDLPAGPYPTLSTTTNIPIVQAYYSSKYLGLIKVNLSKRRLVPGVLPLLLGGANSSSNIQQDPELLEILKKYREPVDKLQTQVVGETMGWGHGGGGRRGRGQAPPPLLGCRSISATKRVRVTISAGAGSGEGSSVLLCLHT